MISLFVEKKRIQMKLSKPIYHENDDNVLLGEDTVENDSDFVLPGLRLLTRYNIIPKSQQASQTHRNMIMYDDSWTRVGVQLSVNRRAWIRSQRQK